LGSRFCTISVRISVRLRLSKSSTSQKNGALIRTVSISSIHSGGVPSPSSRSTRMPALRTWLRLASPGATNVNASGTAVCQPARNIQCAMFGASKYLIRPNVSNSLRTTGEYFTGEWSMRLPSDNLRTVMRSGIGKPAARMGAPSNTQISSDTCVKTLRWFGLIVCSNYFLPSSSGGIKLPTARIVLNYWAGDGNRSYRTRVAHGRTRYRRPAFMPPGVAMRNGRKPRIAIMAGGQVTHSPRDALTSCLQNGTLVRCRT
jgi:hypothetical protein